MSQKIVILSQQWKQSISAFNKILMPVEKKGWIVFSRKITEKNNDGLFSGPT